MSGRCDHCGARDAGVYDLALIRVDDHLMEPGAVACARMTALCAPCRDALATRVAGLLPVWEGGGDGTPGPQAEGLS
ncbi:hypothetical protein [Ruegeria sp.]|uniref:hypothetical protein n=1 Tax=Ruegeria sp. TaxID=1879320 RepID=UPI003B000C4B